MSASPEGAGDLARDLASRLVVFHVIDHLAVGGAERMAVDIANGLTREGVQVHLVATRATGPLTADLDDRIPLHELNRTSRFDLQGLRHFRTLVREHRPALVHAHGWSSLQFSTAGLLGLRRSPKLVFHDHRPSGLEPINWTYRAAAWPLTRAQVAVDETLLEQGPPTRCRSIRVVVPNGSSVLSITPKLDFDVGTPASLVMLANLRPQKAHPVLFRALDLLRSRGVATATDLLGAPSDKGYVAACQTQLEELEMTESVRFVGSCGNVHEVLAGYDLGVLTATTESGPVALIEYLAAGLPFVVTDVGNVTRSLPPRLRRWVVEPDNPSELADRIEQALSRSASERSDDALAGMSFARESLSIEKTVSGVLEVYRRLLTP